MPRFIKSAAKISAVSAFLIAPIVMVSRPACAQPQGMDGSYIGVGGAAGITNGGKTGDAANLGVNIQGRLDFKNAPVSLRGAVLFNNETYAAMPIVSYDIPVAKDANAYLGVGYSFVGNEGKASPLGNKDSLVLTAGVEAGVSKNVVVYGDAKWGIDAYKNSSADAVSLQLGIGYRF